jgi:hypothetical protein
MMILGEFYLCFDEFFIAAWCHYLRKFTIIRHYLANLSRFLANFTPLFALRLLDLDRAIILVSWPTLKSELSVHMIRKIILAHNRLETTYLDFYFIQVGP